MVRKSGVRKLRKSEEIAHREGFNRRNASARDRGTEGDNQ
jgi:hypothetical protein